MRVGLTAATIVALAWAGLALADDDGAADKHAQICAEAEERYVELFGAPSSEAEGVTADEVVQRVFDAVEVP